MDEGPTSHLRRSSSSVLSATDQHSRRHSHPHLLDRSGTPSSSDFEMDSVRQSTDLADDEETGLAHTERRRQTRRKQQSPEAGEYRERDMTQTEEKLTRITLLRTNLINAVLIALWYGFSISISVYNKWMFSAENLDFHFPLFTTSLHMIVQFTLATSVLFFLPRFRPTASHTYTALDSTDDTAKPSEARKQLMTKTFYLTRIGPCGTATALDIGLGNFSLRFISLTFFTMCKSSVLLFVLLFALLFRLESPSWRLGLIITVMTSGVIMMVAGESSFNPLGFALVMSASFCSGFRWSLTQILLLRNPATSNPFSTLFFLTPVMFLALFALAIPIEGFPALGHGLARLSNTKGLPLSIAIMIFPGVLAFLMVSAEFALLKRTSVVTLSVCGIFKEVLTISAAGMAFGDELSPVNISGLVVTILAIAAYNYLKFEKMRKTAKVEAHILLHAEGQPIERVKTFQGTVPEIDAPERMDERRGLMRDSLSLAVDEEPSFERNDGNNSLEHHSLVKRPRDVE